MKANMVVSEKARASQLRQRGLRGLEVCILLGMQEFLEAMPAEVRQRFQEELDVAIEAFAAHYAARRRSHTEPQIDLDLAYIRFVCQCLESELGTLPIELPEVGESDYIPLDLEAFSSLPNLELLCELARGNAQRLLQVDRLNQAYQLRQHVHAQMLASLERKRRQRELWTSCLTNLAQQHGVEVNLEPVG